MHIRSLQLLWITLGATALAAAALAVSAAPPTPPWFEWTTVVNNNYKIPDASDRTFNSYNQPSVNEDGLVVFRARSRGGPPLGPATHGIYTRDMSDGDIPENEIVKILDRTTLVPQPNNLDTLFVETPSFPRIDMWSDTIATRGNHQPVWEYGDTRTGTTGIYTNPFKDSITGERQLITGVAKLGDVPEFSFFEVPEFPGIRFEVFPGAPSETPYETPSPSVTDDGTTATIVFKGNYTVGVEGKTGVYYRQLLKNQPIVLSNGKKLAGGDSPVVLIANTDTLIPGTNEVFGSTAPPSAANGQVVFAGFNNEEHPTLGGIYLAPLEEKPPLTPLVSIGDRVPEGSVNNTFTRLGEGVAFDGRYIAFWGAWGTETDLVSGEAICASGCRNVVVHCPTEGNSDRIEYCLDQCPEPGGCTVEVPKNQGIFVFDTAPRTSTQQQLITVAKTPMFEDFLFWNFSGKVPGVGQGEDDGEPARWRSSAFVAVSAEAEPEPARVATFKAAFKALKNDKALKTDVVGIYLAWNPGKATFTVLDTTMDGQALDSEAPKDSTITELGLEREGLRGDWLAVSAKMGIEGGEEEDDMAGIYITEVPFIGTIKLE